MRGEVLDRQAAHLRTLLAAYFNARHYMAEYPEAAAVKMAPRLGMDPQRLLQAYRGLALPDLQENRQWLDAGSTQLVETANSLVQRMFAHNLIAVRPNLDQLVDARFLPE